MDKITTTQLIKPFDPWQSPLCTCPKKFSFDPYTGCGHRCIYCYATSYIPNFYFPRRKKDLIKRVKRDLEKIPENSLISISNSSDPYQPLEKKYGEFRECLKLFLNYNFKILIITKSNLVLRDIDLLKKLRCTVTITVTTLNEKICKKLEPFAPPSKKRFEALKILAKNKIPTGLRLDPVFPFLTENEIEEIVKKAKESGALHIVGSTFKPRFDSWKRFERVFPKEAKKLKPLYFEKGQKIKNSWYLPEKLRRELMEKIFSVCQKYKISFATCREGFLDLKTAKSCDGSHLIL
ncbi:radical SAM protein [Candidatus Parcubacteria bacterium]|nr:radical SAM protein [Candidatus Parcubacteria bacterium]